MTRALMRHWLLIFIALYGLFNLLPFLAPVLMKIGWSAGGNAIYNVLFGPLSPDGTTFIFPVR
jgi:lipopolysaccharide/colanic/teichoic acid biosynthesis glycosyltransferase